MGKIRYIQDIRSFFKKNIIVNLSSLKKFIPKKRKDYIYLLINNMLKKGEIKRITKGYYSLEEDPSLAVFCFKPSYLGLQNALSIHGLWEQETNPIIITTKKIRQGIRKVSENNIVLHRISPKYFFGIEYLKEGNIYFPVSDKEKTFIDLIYFNQNIDKETLKEFKKRINNKRIKIYLKKYSKNISFRVLDKIS